MLDLKWAVNPDKREYHYKNYITVFAVIRMNSFIETQTKGF